MTTPTITSHMVPFACELAGRVRAGNQQSIAALLRPLTPRQRVELTITLAAMLPVDRTSCQLLAWTDNTALTAPVARVIPLRPCGTHAAYTRHKQRHEEPCNRCKAANRVYERDKKRAQRGRIPDQRREGA